MSAPAMQLEGESGLSGFGVHPVTLGASNRCDMSATALRLGLEA